MTPALPRWRRRFARWCGVLLAAELLVFGFLAAGVHGLVVPLARPVTTDFVSFYAAGALADEGTPALAYDRAAHYAAEQRATAPGIGYQFFFYPPPFLLLAAPLACLPYGVAFATFVLGGLALFLAAVRRIGGAGWLLPALAFPASFWTMGLGQNAFLSAGLFGLGLHLLDRRPALAGLLLGALSYKPQLALLVPVALVAGGHWRALAGAAGGAGALAALSVAAFGAGTWAAFLHAFAAAPAVYQSGRIDFTGMVSVGAAVRLVGGSPGLAMAAQVAAVAGAGCVVAWTWRARPAVLRAPALLAATVVAAPLMLLYDLMLAGLAALFLAAPRARLTAAEAAVLAAVYLLPLLCRPLAELSGVLVAPVVAAALLALAVAGRAPRIVPAVVGVP